MRRPPRCCGLLSLRRAVATACAFLLVPAVAFALGNGKLQIHHIDVGQGDGALLISPNGQTALFDDGTYTNCTNIKAYLQSLGITTVDYHFLSHYHADHLGCIDDLAAIGITIGTAGYDRGYSYSSASYTNYVNTLGAKRTSIAKGQSITLDAGSPNPVIIKCVDLNGAGVYPVSGSDENALSVALKVTYGAFDEEIDGDLTGDVGLGNDVESTVGPEVGDIEVYKVHHHGSRYSSNDNWLTAVSPEVAIISCGDGNTYGHPTLDALTRMHNHGVHTYWTETGAGASPNPSWDKVAHSTIVIQADPGVGATYTVTGNGFSDSYVNGGGPPPPPPIQTTEFASSVTVLKGSISAGDYTRLAVSDDSRLSVSAGVSSNKYYTDWYGSVFLQHPPLDLSLAFEGSFTVSRTQTLYLWNWGTSAWDQIDNATVGTTDVTRTWSTTSPASYVGPSREVRLRVKGNNRSQGSYTSRGDYMAFTYDYTQGTMPAMVGDPAVASFGAIPTVLAAPVPNREAEARATPVLNALAHLEARPSSEGVELTWATGRNEHVDGFNVYHESVNGTRTFVGGEAVVGIRGDEVLFRFVDRSSGSGGTYWLGARACAGPEGLIGPIHVAASASATPLTLAALPNPTSAAMHLDFTIDREGEVRLAIFDLSGRRIASPFQGRLPAGHHAIDWGLTDARGIRVAPGAYFARIEALGRSTLARIIVSAP